MSTKLANQVVHTALTPRHGTYIPQPLYSRVQQSWIYHNQIHGPNQAHYNVTEQTQWWQPHKWITSKVYAS